MKRKPRKTKAMIRAEAAERGEEARYSGKTKTWYFHKFAYLNRTQNG
jgi:hypothetical protein